MPVQAKECHYCSRPVQPTLHGRHGARVDYYRTVTGPAREEQREDARTGDSIRVLRVERLVDVVICRDCWRRPGVQASLKQLRQTGELPESAGARDRG